jgi:hypothetical protein
MIENPESVRGVLSSSRYRLDVSRKLIARLNQSLFDTNRAIWITQKLIARSDKLIEYVTQAYPTESK